MDSNAKKWTNGHCGKITTTDGTIIFEGDKNMFQDCFFDNASWPIVLLWAAKQDFIVKLTKGEAK